MSKCCNAALVMPKNFAVMDEEEMMYLEGGENLPMSRVYLIKSYCRTVAESYIKAGWSNVTVDQLKKEIYGHAYGYYNMTPAIAALGKGGITVANLAWATLVFPSLANGIDIEDKVDRYQPVWEVLWDC